MNRFTEASSILGIGLVLDGVAGLLTDWKNPVAWGKVFAGIGGILKREGAAQ